jgi:hypothetical protein
MPDLPPQPGQRTFDEVYDSADRSKLERLAEREPALRERIELQQRIDAVLCRAFAEPAESLDLAPRPHRLRHWKLWLAAAAAVTLLVGGWRMWTVSNRPDVLGPLYRDTVAAGFVPEVVCTTDEEFTNWCRAYLRQPIRVASRSENVQYVGWNKANVISPISGILLVRVDGDPVIVVLERRDRQTRVPGAVRDKSLHVFSRHVGEAVLYEVTPKDHAAILPVLEKMPLR